MTPEEAYVVAKIVSRADGGCDVCVSALCLKLSAAFPSYDWEVLTAKAKYEREEALKASDYDFESLDRLIS